jgi:hypothetical protein
MLTGVRMQDAYNLMLKKNWIWMQCASYMLPPLHGMIRVTHRSQVSLLESHWRASRPDLVVSLVPQFNRSLFESARRVMPDVPFVTILTDLADYPPHFWIERQQQYFICGTERAAEQARELGIRADRIYKTSGMILHPRFYDTQANDIHAERKRWGLDPNVPTALILFGGHGSAAMVEIAQRLDESKLKLQLILMCGRNESLALTLRKTEGRLRRLVVGFTDDVPCYMHLSDFFIGKPGPGSISEALMMKLPVIVERNARTLPQERYNAEWILEKEVGMAVPSFQAIAPAVEKLLTPAAFMRYRANAAAMKNRAGFEIVGMLREILDNEYMNQGTGRVTGLGLDRVDLAKL